MMQLLLVTAIIIVVAADEGATVRSESLPFCGYSSKTSTCPGDVSQVDIRYPFWIENGTVDDARRDCQNHPSFQIKCAANGRPVINISSNLYYVLENPLPSIRYVTIMDVVVDAQECPQPRRNFSVAEPFFFSFSYTMTFFYNCSRYPPNVVQHIPCLDNYYNDTSSSRSFALSSQEILSNQYDWYRNCKEAVVVPVSSYDSNAQYVNYAQLLKYGFPLEYRFPVNCGNCELSGGKCWVNETNLPVTSSFHCDCKYHTKENDICRGRYFDSYYGNNNGLSIQGKIGTALFIGIGGLLLSLLVLCCRRKCYQLCTSIASVCRKKIKGPTNVEMFLDKNQEGISSHSYKYVHIKNMTNSFKDTLGQGGYGSVFKGKLRDGRLVAVKVLNKSKGKGEDFINEVATIGRTNHINVVSLLGFCAEGTKRALVYEFMQNGSLEKFIHNVKDSSTANSLLGWEKLYQIALGIARGLEYLHRGCNTRILHFDIKPHNILLDKDFCPKISDFGLAKLCPTTESLVSMAGARGTPGYIAPEVYCGNFGGVSHKSDVYSYGMMVLEMIGGRKNMDILVENTSQIYFPQWIYKRLRGNLKVEESEEIEVAVVAEGVLEEETDQKMLTVALWCIQAHPGDRPSITKVVEMLEGNTKDLKFPPNPFPDPSCTSSLS